MTRRDAQFFQQPDAPAYIFGCGRSGRPDIGPVDRKTLISNHVAVRRATSSANKRHMLTKTFACSPRIGVLKPKKSCRRRRLSQPGCVTERHLPTLIRPKPHRLCPYKIFRVASTGHGSEAPHVDDCARRSGYRPFLGRGRPVATLTFTAGGWDV